MADHVKKVHKKEWTNADIAVDKEELALMRKICCREADIIQGYVDLQGNKLARPPKQEDPSQQLLQDQPDQTLRFPPPPMQ